MAQRLRLGARFRGREYLLELSGELDGSTAFQVLDAVSLAPACAREVVLDLTGLSRLETFGLDVLQSGVRGRSGGRPVRFEGVACRA
jgi:anti-anti-sigma regulatory factor